MQPTREILIQTIAAVAFLLAAAGAFAYTRVSMRIAAQGGKARVDKFGTMDLLVGGVLIALLILMAIDEFTSPPMVPHDTGLVSNAILFFGMVTLLSTFMRLRGFDLQAQLGLRAAGPGRILGLAFLLLLAAYPMMICAEAVWNYMLVRLNMPPEPQLPVKFFVDALQHGHHRSVALILFTGIVVAPVSEEFIFRGYIYGMLKRYTGMVPAILLNAALFSAVHASITALPELFLLAVCFTIAYEYTGSILVNMCMHAIFNLLTFVFLYYFSHSLPQ